MRRHASDVLWVVGCLLICYGVLLCSVPAGLITLGICTLVSAILLTRIEDVNESSR